MKDVKIVQALQQDKKQLLDFFKHYQVKNLIQHRASCYLSHGFTIVAKDNDKIVGIVQWYVKENPNAGLAEFEELYVLENYRGKKIGSRLVKQAIKSVKDYFTNLKVKPHQSTWQPIIAYGKKLGIPEEQLDFWPNRFQDERHYFESE